MTTQTADAIEPEVSKTLCGLFKERVKRSGDAIAYRHYDKQQNQWLDTSWNQAATKVARLQAALAKEALEPGDKVAIMLRNSPEWAYFEQAALGMGLVVVPLYTNDRAENISYVLQDAGVKILLIEGHEQLTALNDIESQMDGLIRLLSVNVCAEYNKFSRLIALEEWTRDIPKEVDHTQLQTIEGETDDLATIVYTSGTTGRPKGVMLSHGNILTNSYSSGWLAVKTYPDDLYLSFLPLSHMLERMAGYYIPMTTGGTIAFARSVQDLGEDLLTIKPTVLISVPRIYERVSNKITLGLEQKSNFARKLFLNAVETGWQQFQKPSFSLSWPILKTLVANKVMAKLGGRLRLAICGGAPLSPSIAKTFIGLGLNLIQGYGLTETSPVISVNRPESNEPASVGMPLANVEVKIAETGELLTKGPHVMLGYWNNPTATSKTVDTDGWLHTGDKARIEDDGRVFITGRIKEIIVLSNGEKVPPADMELAISMNPLFEQVMVIGEQKPYLTAIIVLNEEQWGKLCRANNLDNQDPNTVKSQEAMQLVIPKVKERIHGFPGYAQIQRVALTLQPWTVENGLITPTLKLKRNKIIEHHQQDVDALYEGH